MTFPIVDKDTSVDELAEIAQIDGKMRELSIEDHIDLAITYEHMREKIRYKTGEKVEFDYGSEPEDE